MPKLEFSQAELKGYFEGTRKGSFYKEAINKCDEFAPHADGIYPAKLIDERRPNEPEEVKDYRKSIWKPKTKPTFSKILSSLSKIRRSSDWSIKHVDSGKFTRVAEEETLERYSEKEFPYFGSVTNWVFSTLLKKYLTDPNGVIFIMPLETEVQEREYLKPYPFIFDSCHVIDFVPEDYAVLVNPEGVYYVNRKGKMEFGKSYYVVTTASIFRYDQVDDKGTMVLQVEYLHGLPILPVFKIGAIISKAEGYNFLYESRISGILPDLDEALREYSDLQAAKVLHIFPERWEYTQHECNTCKGTGRRPNPGWQEGTSIPSDISCGTCSGRGYIASGPYSKMLLRPPGMGETQLPTPPAGYVEKDVEIVKVMEASAKQHIYDALSSINFQFLEQTPLNQSGFAKEVDKEELNNLVHAIAEDLVRVMDQCYMVIAFYRYKSLYPSFDEINQMVPSVAVPEHFDLLSSQFMQDEIGKSKNAKLNPVIISAMEVEYTGKRFVNEPEVRDRLALILQLDPLPNISEDEKMAMLSNRGISQVNYVISSNIHEFVQRALDQDKNFVNLSLPLQKEKMRQYAQAQIDQNSAARQLLAGDLLPESGAEEAEVE